MNDKAIADALIEFKYNNGRKWKLTLKTSLYDGTNKVPELQRLRNYHINKIELITNKSTAEDIYKIFNI